MEDRIFGLCYNHFLVIVQLNYRLGICILAMYNVMAMYFYYHLMTMYFCFLSNGNVLLLPI